MTAKDLLRESLSKELPPNVVAQFMYFIEQPKVLSSLIILLTNVCMEDDAITCNEEAIAETYKRR